MRSPSRVDDADAGDARGPNGTGSHGKASGPNDAATGDQADQTISDETTDRLFRVVMIAMAGVVVAGLFAAAGIWALQGDEEPPP